MSYSGRMQNSHYYSVFFAPRGRDRIYDLGMHIAQMYLSPFDKLMSRKVFLLLTLIILTYASRRHSRRWECLPMQF